MLKHIYLYCMKTFIIHPETPERAKMLKAVIKALNLTYEKSMYKPEYVAMVKMPIKILN